MSIIRGKIHRDREFRPNKISHGDLPAYEKNGKWYDKKTHKECKTYTLDELLKEHEEYLDKSIKE